MQPKAHGLALVSLLDVLILLDLVAGLAVVQSVWLWAVLHIALVICGTVLLQQMLFSTLATDVNADDPAETETSKSSTVTGHHKGDYKLIVLIAMLGLMVPGVGLGGIALSMIYGLHASRARTYVAQYWQVTPAATLPYVAPKERTLPPVDSRGFVEQLLYSKDDEDIYRKVLASANVRTSLAIDTLKQAMRHGDERVRLTAYKTLDKKVTALNKQIQKLEQSVQQDDEDSSDKWLQIASNYWELITLEGGEAIARKQLLASAASAAIKAVGQDSGNRNAHLVLGRIWLAQGEVRRATVALERSQALGMPGDKVIPYLAECAYINRDFPRVQTLLQRLDPAIVEYPPLSHVARYWT